MDYEGFVAKGTMLGSGGDDRDRRLAPTWSTRSCGWRGSTPTRAAPSARSAARAPRGPRKILERIVAGEGKTEDLDLLLDLAEQHDRQDDLRAERFVRRAGGERHPEVPAASSRRYLSGQRASRRGGGLMR